MATDINLKWEWPADREIGQKFVIQVDSIKPPNGGLFGLKRSPSLVEGIPDPMVVKGQVIRGDGYFLNRSVALTLPKLELDNITEGDSVALGLVDNTVCICIKKLGTAEFDLSAWKCSSQ